MYRVCRLCVGMGVLGAALTALIMGCRNSRDCCCCCSPCAEQAPTGVPASEQQEQKDDIKPMPQSQVQESPYYNLDVTSGQDKRTDRRTFADITAKPWFAHAKDHSWLHGELQFVKATHSWRVRYASVDENDPYEGSVILVLSQSLSEFHNGQAVRVEGRPATPSLRGPDADYIVHRIIPLPEINANSF